jgi:hypothetical protein
MNQDHYLKVIDGVIQCEGLLKFIGELNKICGNNLFQDVKTGKVFMIEEVNNGQVNRQWEIPCDKCGNIIHMNCNGTCDPVNNGD